MTPIFGYVTLTKTGQHWECWWGYFVTGVSERCKKLSAATQEKKLFWWSWPSSGFPGENRTHSIYGGAVIYSSLFEPSSETSIGLLVSGNAAIAAYSVCCGITSSNIKPLKTWPYNIHTI